MVDTGGAETIGDTSSVQPIVHGVLKRFKLSKRETEATVFLALGLRAKEIAQQMSCSDKTVYAHLARVCRKTRCRDAHEVICTLLAITCQVRALERE